MSTLSNLLKQVEGKDPQLAADLAREVKALSNRRAFGLNFERHVPEAVELPGRPVRRGDKVRFLAERGERPGNVDQTLWRVMGVTSTETGHVATLVRQPTGEGEPETATRPVEDLVVVAEFRDPIFPGLKSTGRVERGGDKPFHTVINAENYHALQALLYTHQGKVDAIYIDPPYNTGARDWKYNNDYVDGDDIYRHSKWLAFMERRLKLAKRLLNPENSVLIVTIDEKEYLRLGLLLEQVFPGEPRQMVSIAVSPSGASRDQAFRRSDEYGFFLAFGAAAPTPLPLGPEWQGNKGTSTKKIRWNGLMRSGTDAARGARESMFFPILLDETSGSWQGVGPPLPLSASRHDFVAPPRTVAVWPIRADGSEGRWQISAEAVERAWTRGQVKTGRFRGADTAISYLKAGEVRKIASGVFGEVTMSPTGHVAVASEAEGNRRVPTTQWSLVAHSAADHGSTLLRSFLPGRRFPFPKSLYAVEDALRFFVADKPHAIILDFFAGSGTTAHAVMRLNRQDGGRRQCISVTNNEVSAEEQSRLRKLGLRPGDPEWEALGICEYITKPRLTAAVTGLTPDGEPVKGDYKFTDEFPMSEGFEENVEFFTMTYEPPLAVAHNRAFEAIAPLLWLKAGAQGRRIEHVTDGFDVADTYAVLFDLDASRDFLAALAKSESVRMAFVHTDDDRSYQMVCAELPAQVEPVRLYESYIANFTLNAGRE